MNESGNGRFSGCGLFVLWTLLLIFFIALVGIVFGFQIELDQGFPLWLLIGRVLVVVGCFVTILGLMGRRKWGVYGFFASAAAMIPLSVVYSYYSLQLTQGIVVTLGWIIRNTLITAVAIMLMVTVVFWSIRVQGK